MASEQGKDTPAAEATTAAPATTATETAKVETQAPAAEVKTEAPAKTETASAEQGKNKQQKAAQAAPAAKTEPAPVELVAKASALELVVQRYNFTEGNIPEVVTQIDVFLTQYEQLITDGKFNTQEELKELSGKLTRAFGAALNQTGPLAAAALDLIVFHFATRSTDVYTRLNLYRTPKAAAGQVDRNTRFTHTLSRLFLLLSKATVKASVSKDIDLPKVYEVLRSTGQQATLAAYLA